MKKQIYIILIGLSGLATAQTYNGKVGVNTSTPEATMDIKPTTANAETTATTVEGVLIPRVSRLRAANMGTTVPESTLVYVNSVADGNTDATSTTTNVDVEGYYYFTGGKWVKLDNTIYNIDGTLTSNRRVNTADKYLVIGSKTFLELYVEDELPGDNSFFEIRNSFVRNAVRNDAKEVGIFEIEANKAGFALYNDITRTNIAAISLSKESNHFFNVNDGKNASFIQKDGVNIVSGTLQTTGPLQISGAVYVTPRNVKGPKGMATLQAADYFIVIFMPNNQSVDFPAPGDNKDRIIIVKNSSVEAGGAGTYTYAINPPDNGNTIAPGKTQTIYSDGTKWYIISEY